MITNITAEKAKHNKNGVMSHAIGGESRRIRSSRIISSYIKISESGLKRWLRG